MAVRSAPDPLQGSRTDAVKASGQRVRGKWTVPPVLVRQVRNGVVESVHRGDIVEVDAAGRMLHLLGDPDRIVNLRSTVKPFGLIALLRAGGRREFDLTTEELAIMTSSHSGEDVHVRTIQAMYRRLGIPQGVLACGAEGMPLDALTAARLARDGERPSSLRHMCSGQHSVFILLAKLGGWELETYWQDDHPAQAAVREAVGAAFATDPARIVTGIDGCGILTYAFPLREVARAFAILADPDALPAGDPRVGARAALRRDPRRDAGLPGARRRDARSARHLADEGDRRPLREQERHGGPARHRDPARPAKRGRCARVGDGDQDRGRRRLRPRAVGGSVEALRQAGCSRARRCASWPATTVRPRSIRTAGWRPRRSRSSSSRPSAS